MKSGNKVMKNWGFLVLALSTLGSTGYAATAVPASNKEGVSLEDLAKIAPHLKITLEGQNLAFYGKVPVRCAPAKVAPASEDANIFEIRMPRGCEVNFEPKDGEPMIEASKAFGKVPLLDISGPVKLRFLNDGDSADPSRTQDEDFKGPDGKVITAVSSADREMQNKQKRVDELEQNIELHCGRGNWDMVDKDMNTLINEFQDIISKSDADALRQAEVADWEQNFEADLKAAKNDAVAALVYKKYADMTKLPGSHFDAATLQDAYISQRFAILKQMVGVVGAKGSNIKAEDVDASAQSWNQELMAMGDDTYGKYEAQFTKVYGGLAQVLFKKKDYDGAAAYDIAGKEFAVTDDLNTSFDEAIETIYKTARQSCMDQAKKADSFSSNGNGTSWKGADCDQYIKKSKEYAANIVQDYKDRAENSGSDDDKKKAELANEQYAYEFGNGSADYQMSGMGEFTDGAIGQEKWNNLKGAAYQYQQQQYMQMYYMQMYGMTPQGSATQPAPSSGF